MSLSHQEKSGNGVDAKEHRRIIQRNPHNTGLAISAGEHRSVAGVGLLHYDDSRELDSKALPLNRGLGPGDFDAIEVDDFVAAFLVQDNASLDEIDAVGDLSWITVAIQIDAGVGDPESGGGDANQE